MTCITQLKGVRDERQKVLDGRSPPMVTAEPLFMGCSDLTMSNSGQLKTGDTPISKFANSTGLVNSSIRHLSQRLAVIKSNSVSP